jgi:transposase
VGAIVARVWADTGGREDLFAGLRRIGIDEISYKRNHKYLTIVVDHDTGRLVWAAPGRDQATLRGFFDALGPERCALITHVSADGASWIGQVVAERCPKAVRCADPFHVVRWARARRCRIPVFVRLQRTIVEHQDLILASIKHGLSNGLIESVNTKIRLITRMAFGFAGPEPLIALAMLNLGGHRPALPGR